MAQGKSTVDQLVYQERYSGRQGVDEWRTVDAATFAEIADKPLTERRVLKVVEHDMTNAGPFVAGEN